MTLKMRDELLNLESEIVRILHASDEQNKTQNIKQHVFGQFLIIRPNHMRADLIFKSHGSQACAREHPKTGTEQMLHFFSKICEDLFTDNEIILSVLLFCMCCRYIVYKYMRSLRHSSLMNRQCLKHLFFSYSKILIFMILTSPCISKMHTFIKFPK